MNTKSRRSSKRISGNNSIEQDVSTDTTKRAVSLTGPITADAALMVMAEMLSMDAQSRDPINFVISSPGGDVLYGLAIVDMMRHIQAPVATYAIGLAASMAAIILAAGSRGCRYAFQHTRIFLHQAHAKLSGKTDDLASEYGLHMSFTSEIEDVLFCSTGRTRSQIRMALRKNMYMAATEARAFGIIDHVIDEISPS